LVFTTFAFQIGRKVLSLIMVPITVVSCANAEEKNKDKKKTVKYLMLKFVGLM